MTDDARLPLTVAVSTRSLFALEEEHRIFIEQGVEAYARLQRERERDSRMWFRI
jgi:5'-nucleotidase